ncbi:Calcineurin-like phosphoesterase superfamily domain protein [Aquisphaera giovannonii]|uniref:Calcineurin-like phosphoesterase superfamily domain protein n=1 Tax=Aquisphaera giovannonii TaxID=406548 RepID=A0A5B9W0B8_9BACT|nr:metallophosphoesterase [Aquisphaera giovannonii]QEH34072.1 Calcineurin-like phosphoesterase superfamily domain protein [Aquisphaera giovannonii]
MPDTRPRLRIVHVSDIHFWRYAWNPLRLLGKRAVGMASLLRGRAARFRLERIEDVVDRVLSLEPDHILITGDLTTTALPAEFRAARKALGPWLRDRGRVTVLPGNHDRYTVGAHRNRRFEEYFGEFMPKPTFPWLRHLDGRTAILGLDPTRAAVSARGLLPAHQFAKARELVQGMEPAKRRLIVACHYPLHAPEAHRRELSGKRMINAGEVSAWLAGVGPHVYCCGHVHAAWSFRPEAIPGQLCLNAGAPLLRDHSGHRPPGFLEITLEGERITVDHHAWRSGGWIVAKL